MIGIVMSSCADKHKPYEYPSVFTGDNYIEELERISFTQPNMIGDSITERYFMDVSPVSLDLKDRSDIESSFELDDELALPE